MKEPILDFDENLGFCTWIEVTKSTLFSVGIDITNEVSQKEEDSFRVYVPPVDSQAAAQIREFIAKNSTCQLSNLNVYTPLLIEVAPREEIDTWSIKKQVLFVNNLANRFLRAYEHTYFDMWIPRHRLDGREIVKITQEGSQQLDYEAIILDLDEILEHYLPIHVDVEKLHLSTLMTYPESIPPSWRILIDGTRHFENGNFREAILCACSAAEIIASPKVESWLYNHTLSPKSGGVRNAVREMGNPLRFELCLSGSCSSAFSDVSKEERADLLSKLCRMNTLRNAVVHRGEEPKSNDVVTALQASAQFVCKNWIEIWNAKQKD